MIDRDAELNDRLVGMISRHGDCERLEKQRQAVVQACWQSLSHKDRWKLLKQVEADKAADNARMLTIALGELIAECYDFPNDVLDFSKDTVVVNTESGVALGEASHEIDRKEWPEQPAPLPLTPEQKLFDDLIFSEIIAEVYKHGRVIKL